MERSRSHRKGRAHDRERTDPGSLQLPSRDEILAESGGKDDPDSLSSSAEFANETNYSRRNVTDKLSSVIGLASLADEEGGGGGGGSGSVIIHRDHGTSMKSEPEGEVDDALSSAGSVVIHKDSGSRSKGSGSVIHHRGGSVDSQDYSSKKAAAVAKIKNNSPLKPNKTISSSNLSALVDPSIGTNSSNSDIRSRDAIKRSNSRNSGDKKKKGKHRRTKSKSSASSSLSLNEIVIPGISKVMAFTKNEDERELMERIIQEFAALDEKNPLLVDRILEQLREAPLIPAASSRAAAVVSPMEEAPMNEFAELLIDRWRSRVTSTLNLAQITDQK